MRGIHGSGAKRIAAGILGLTLLAVVLLSSFCIAIEAHHDCTGEDCPVCVCLQHCANTLRQLGESSVLLIGAIVPVLVFFLAAITLGLAVLSETPVSRKVRLNN